MDFANKVVIVTGASSGIGAACSVHFAKLSAKLSLVGRNSDNLAKVANQCQKFNGFLPLTIIADITVEDEVKKIVEETINHHGRIDVLVNNAGILPMAKIEDGVDAYDRVMATNVRGPFLLTNLALPYLSLTKGNIVNVSSILSTVPLPSATAYCMSKAAVDMFTKCAALEFGAQGIRVNAANPGAVKTNLFKTAGMNVEENDKFFDHIEQSSPLRRLPLPEDVAEVVVFLASAKAKCITGTCYLTDSGSSISGNQNSI